GDPVPGLYVGEAGIAAALLRTGLVLKDRRLLAAARERARRLRALPHRAPDLFNGSAGRLRLHLAAWDAGGDPFQLEAAREAGEHLLATAEAVEGGLAWSAPEGFGSLTGRRQLGYAHGAAGIADALLDLHAATPEPRLLEAALG